MPGSTSGGRPRAGADREPVSDPIAPRREWYLPVAAHLGEAYLRYGFTRGTAQEVDFLWEELGLQAGMRVLDVGCGPGRHAVELGLRGLRVVGVDLSPDFVALARRRAREAGAAISFFEIDARDLPFEEEFDAAVSICEGAFGLGLDDLQILKAMVHSLKRGGRLAAGAANVFHVLRHVPSAELDPVTMLMRETATVTGADGSEREFVMWNSCYTPREMEWIANGAGLDPEAVWGVSPGDYRRVRPSFDHPELLLVARRP